MRFVICFLVACTLSVSTTLFFDLSEVPAFFIGVILGQFAIAVAQIWQYKSGGL